MNNSCSFVSHRPSLVPLEHLERAEGGRASGWTHEVVLNLAAGRTVTRNRPRRGGAASSETQHWMGSTFPWELIRWTLCSSFRDDFIYVLPINAGLCVI